MCSYLILFKKKMIDFTDSTTREWLRELGIKGRIVSVDEIDEIIHPIEHSLDDNHMGFAVINAKDNGEINTIIEACPKLNKESLEVYKLR